MTQPDMQSCEVDLGAMGRYPLEPVNHAPVPQGGRLIAAKIIPRKIFLSQGYAREAGIPQTSYAFRVSVIENADGTRYAQGEIGSVDAYGNGTVKMSFSPIGDLIEDKEFRAINEAAREMWARHKEKSLFDLVAA